MRLRRNQRPDFKARVAMEAGLFQRVGPLRMELEWLKSSLSCSDARELRQLVDHGDPELSVNPPPALTPSWSALHLALLAIAG